MADAQRNREIGAIHVARQQLGLDDSEYRSLLEAWTGKASAAKLTGAQRHLVLDNFRRMGFERKDPAAKLSIGDDDVPQVKKIKAMWLSLWRAGVVKSPSLASLNAFVKRVVGIDHVNWCTPAQHSTVIEALKAWSNRAAAGQSK